MNIEENRLETISTDSNELLTGEDLTALSNIHSTYVTRYKFVTAMLESVTTAYRQYQSDYSEDADHDCNHPLYPVKQAVASLQKGAKNLTLSVISQVEQYFSDTYHLVLLSYAKSQQLSDNVMLENVSPIVSFIFQQVGTELGSAGASRVKKEFTEQFLSEKKRPLFKGYKVRLPNYTWYDDNSTAVYLGSKEPVKKLIHALYLFHGAGLQLGQTDKELIACLHYSEGVLFAVDYPILNTYRIRFFKSGRIDLSFPDAKTSARFLLEMGIVPESK